MTEREIKNDFLKNIFEQYYKKICTFTQIHCISKNVEDVYDCAEEVFILAIQNYDKLVVHPNKQAWLLRTTKNVVYNFNRKFLNHQSLIGLSDVPESIEDIVLNKIEKNEIDEKNIAENIIHSLSENERKLYLLRYGEHMSYEQISQNLNIPKSAVSMRITRLNMKLKEKIKNIF